MQIEIDKPYHIFAETLDEGSLRQFESAMACDFVVQGALMPDAHLGYALPIGAVIATQNVVVPAWVGYDIGCGMCALPTRFSRIEVEANAQLIFKRIYEEIPVGFAHNKKATSWPDSCRYARSDWLNASFPHLGLNQIGTLGGGNHFAEIGVDAQDQVWIVIHSGSRNMGKEVASHYMREASGDGKAREGHFGLDINSALGMDYIRDMQFCLAFALENRREIMRRLLHCIAYYCKGGADWMQLVNRTHNHAEFKDGLWIHRKGATHAEKGMMGVIPGNMRDGSFIVRGLGNAESLCSSSHGAGRALGRKQAERTLTLDGFEETMKGIVAKVDASTLDESPLAYKDIFEVMERQKDLVEVVAHIRPLINMKG